VHAHLWSGHAGQVPLTHAPGLGGPRHLAIARDIAGEVARRLARPETLSSAISAIPDPKKWQPASLALGEVSCAPLYAELHRLDPGEGWDSAGHRFLTSGAAAAGSGGLFVGGLVGVGVAAALLRGQTDRYQKLLGRLDTALTPPSGHDLITGATGFGVYLLMRPCSAGHSALVRTMVAAAGERWPFRVPAGHLPADWSVTADYADCGLAHGVAGPLALLSLLSAQVEVPAATIVRLADWLLDRAEQDEWGLVWPAAIAAGERIPAPQRASWCRGVAGIARALWLAGRAVDEPRYTDAASAAMVGLLQAPQVWGLESPNLCHGLAGLLMVTAAFAADDTRFAAAAEDLFARLVAAYDPGLPLGFAVDDPGLLTGAAGVALALLAAAGGGAPSTRLFLVA
jgi:hypothetical protein